jgi:acetyl-CoA synthetase
MVHAGNHDGGPRVIVKDLASLAVTPNLLDEDAVRRSFTWEAARSRLAGLAGGGLNIGHEATTAQLLAGRGGREAIRCIRRDGSVESWTYAELDRLTNRFANALAAIGVARGERLFLLLPRSVQLFTAMLGALKAGVVVSPLFTAFGPEPVRQRIARGDGVAIVTNRSLYDKKIVPVRAELPSLREAVLLDGETGDGVQSWDALVGSAPDEFTTVETQPDDMALIHFTSGTTGVPKGAVHVHEAVVAHHATAAYALDFHDGDVFWCTADPGWVTGTSYGVIAPLTHGLTCIVDEREFDAEQWYRVLQDHAVTVWYTAPTAIRMLMRTGDDIARQFDLSKLRFIGSVGEPLNPEAVVWGQDALGLPIHDNWWQTETGGIMIANLAAMDIRPGSMGKPLPGVEAAILATGDEGEVVERDGAPIVVTQPDVEGHLALRRGWPSMFRGYLHEDERYAKCFHGDWYVTGDLARRDADGYFWFVGRSDDVIKSAGHLIGPFEVESVLMEHPAVVEAGVIGKPDPVAGAVVKAFVTLRAGYEPTDALRRELIGYGRKRLGVAVAPREITFDQHLPKTKSGKIMRRLLRARELGLPEGDLSTLESAL